MDPVMEDMALHLQSDTIAMHPSPPAPSPSHDIDSDDEAECRVCRGEAELDRRLFAPCKCSGSIRFTHSDCLEQWLEHSGKSFCELCGHKFEFKPLYDSNAPEVLPWSELVSTVASVAFFKWVPFVVRACLVVVLWLGVAPWCTSWLYRMWLLRASAMVNVNFSERFDLEHAVADIYSGIVLIVVIIFSFLALMSFADFLRFHLDHIDEPVDEPLPHAPHHHNHAHNHNHHHQPQQGNHNHNHAAAAAVAPPAAMQQAEQPHPLHRLRRPMADERRPLVGQDDDHESSDEEDPQEEVIHREPRGADDAMPFAGVFARHPREELGWPAVARDGDRADAEDNGAVADEPRRDLGLRLRRPVGQVIRVPHFREEQAQVPLALQRNAPAAPIAAAQPAQPQPPRRLNNNNNNNNAAANNRGDVWDDDFEHMEINIAMDELLGLRGDFVVLFRNVSWLLAFNGAYLGLFAFIPYTLGSTIFSAGVKIYSALPIAPTVAAWMADDASIATEDLSVGSFFLRTLAKAMDDAKKSGDCLQLVDLSTCVVGYLSICFTIVLWRWMVTTASPFMNRPLMGGALWALRCLTAIVKVSTLLMLKMVVLPIILGVGIDMATLRLFDVTLQGRITFFLQNMVGALLVHWVLGITFMLFITVSVLQLREVMHPDILAKVIRPQEAHPDLLRSLLSETCAKHARRMLLSLVIYAGLLVVLIHVPIRLLQVVAAAEFFPLTLRFQHYSPEIQVPVELLVVHLIVLGVLEHAKNEIGRCQHVGIRFFCSKLGLTEYLLPRVEVTWPSRTDRLGDEYVLGPPPLHFHPQAAVPPDELRIHGRRYLPWPEDGLEDQQETEYVLLHRRVPSKWLHARVATLAVLSWLVLVATMGTLIFGTLFLGRSAMAPLERLTGIAHDPLALAAGVQIAWHLVNGLNAVNMLTLPKEHVEPALLARGYCVKNMTPGNAMSCVLGWAFMGPFFVGFIVCTSLPAAKATWFESFWLGYLAFNVAAWFVCCFNMKRNRRRRRQNQPEVALDDEFEEDVDDFMDQQEDLLDDFDDDDDDFMDEQDENRANADAGAAAQARNNGDAGAAADGGAVAAARAPPPGEVDIDGIIVALRKCYKQIMFNIHVHDNDAVRLRQDNIGDRCFDVKFFMDHVLTLILAFLTAAILTCGGLAFVAIQLWGAGHPYLVESAFAISTAACGSLFTIVRSGSFVKQWTANFAESIRNERYLIGRELQDMAR